MLHPCLGYQGKIQSPGELRASAGADRDAQNTTFILKNIKPVAPKPWKTQILLHLCSHMFAAHDLTEFRGKILEGEDLFLSGHSSARTSTLTTFPVHWCFMIVPFPQAFHPAIKIKLSHVQNLLKLSFFFFHQPASWT